MLGRRIAGTVTVHVLETQKGLSTILDPLSGEQFEELNYALLLEMLLLVSSQHSGPVSSPTSLYANDIRRASVEQLK